ncbi:hypothetical protein H4R19_005962, partial [Coemansia spiralis]
MADIEVLDDFADTPSWPAPENQRPGAPTAVVAAPKPPLADPVQDLIDISDLDDYGDLDDLDDSTVAETEASAPVFPLPNGAAYQPAKPVPPTTVQQLPNATLDDAIDLCSDMEEDLDIINVQDLDFEVEPGSALESPKHALEACTIDATLKRPRVDGAGGGIGAPAHPSDNCMEIKPPAAGAGEQGGDVSQRLAELAKEKARISDEICDLEFADEIGNDNEISLLRQRRIDVMNEIRRLQST